MKFKEDDKQSTTSQLNHPEPVNCGSSKPRICEVLGVEVEEKFRVESDSCIFYPEAFVDEYGIVRAAVGQSMKGTHICQLISGELHLIRKPRFTEAEVADARVLMKAWPCGQLKREGCDDLYFHPFPDFIRKIVPINPEMFPSIRTGEIVALNDIVGGDTE